MTPKKAPARSSSRWFPRLFFPLVVLLILAGLYLSYRDGGQPPWARNGDAATELPEPSGAERLSEAVTLGARELGVSRSRIARRPGTEGVPRYEFRCPDRLHPMGANRWLTRIFADAGIQVRDCREEGGPTRPKLHYRLAAEGRDGPAEAELLLYPPTGEPPLREAMPRLALIVDDFGYNFSRTARGMLELDLPLTVSILPGLRYSQRVEKEARRRGHAVFLHLPMEPRNYPALDPGPGAIFTGMSTDSLRRHLRVLSADFERLDGFNNHMGSKASQDEALLAPILDWAVERKLLVVDSMTDPGSRIYPLARSRDLPALKADLFLDGAGEGEAEIMSRLADAAEIARKRGWALVICHPRSATLKALRSMTPRLRDYGLRFVTVPQLVASLAESDPAGLPAGQRRH